MTYWRVEKNVKGDIIVISCFFDVVNKSLTESILVLNFSISRCLLYLFFVHIFIIFRELIVKGSKDISNADDKRITIDLCKRLKSTMLVNLTIQVVLVLLVKFSQLLPLIIMSAPKPWERQGTKLTWTTSERKQT